MLLPPEFADLSQFAGVAISDDLQRDAATNAMTEAEKRAFIEAMWPHMEAINAYLDAHNDEAACNLGDMAQAAGELAVELNYWPAL